MHQSGPFDHARCCVEQARDLHLFAVSYDRHRLSDFRSAALFFFLHESSTMQVLFSLGLVATHPHLVGIGGPVLLRIEPHVLGGIS